MRVVVRVYRDSGGTSVSTLALSVEDETYIEQATEDIKEFINEQHFEIKEEYGDE